MANSKCNGCIHQEPDRPGLFCYMFRVEPEELPCGQYQNKNGKGLPHLNIGTMGQKKSNLVARLVLGHLLAGK